MGRDIILCVDDKLEIRTLLEELFSDEYNVKVADSGKLALELINNFNPKVAIIDMNLLDIKGTDLVIQFKGIDPNIKNIIMTGEEMTNETDDYLIIKKPFDIFKLKEIVQKLCENYEI